MDFFLEWLSSRLRENGWPKTGGLFKRRQYITEQALVEVLHDLVRIALGLGCCLPDSAKSIAITLMDVDESTTQDDVERWIDTASARGEAKFAALPDVHPAWLRLCSLTLNDDRGNVFHKVWAGSQDKYEIDDITTKQDLILNAVSLAAIAMCWALRHPEDAKSALNNWSDKQQSELLTLYDDAAGGDQQALGELTLTIHETWVKMAQDSINILSNTTDLPDFNDPATWRHQ